MRDVLVAVLLVAGMLAVGTALDVRALVERLRRPGPLSVVLGMNLLAVPALGWAAVRVVELDPAVALGLVLATAAPGGGTGALLALHARGDVPTAAVLQVLLAVASLGITPLWIAVHTADAPVELDLLPLVLALLALQLAPLAVGARLAARHPTLARAVQVRARRTADVILIVLVGGLLVTQIDQLPRLGPSALVVMALVALVTLSPLALPVGTVPVRRSAAMTTLVRNLSLALLAASYAPEPDVTSLAVLAYGLLMYLLGGGAVVLLRRSRCQA